MALTRDSKVMRDPCARGEVATGGRGQPVRVHEVSLILNPVEILLGAPGYKIEEFWSFEPVEELGERQKGGTRTAPNRNPCPVPLATCRYVHPKALLSVSARSSLHPRPTSFGLEKEFPPKPVYYT